MISKTHTLDGVKVEPGLMVWDYDLKRRRVGRTFRTYDGGTPWWEMEDPETGQPAKAMDPSRMWTRRPGDNKPASDEPGLFDDIG
jgi:hypothetical protein